MTNLDGQPSVTLPPLPELKDVTIDPNTTALLVLDMQKQFCNLDRGPSCVASIPKVNTLLKQARANKMLVVYSLIRIGKVTDIVDELAPLGGEPVVSSGPDKFIGTELESILRGKNIEQVIVTGTAAHGAALHTAAGAAFRGFKVIGHDLPHDPSPSLFRIKQVSVDIYFCGIIIQTLFLWIER